MDYWHTIPAMADRATRETGKAVTPEDIFNLCRRGRVRVGARIPGWVSAGIGELQWHYADGSQVTQTYSFDGIARWLDCAKLENLLIHDRVTLAGVQCPDEESGITMTAGLDSPFVTMDDLRIPEREYLRILAAINGEPKASRKIEGTGPTPTRHTLEPWVYLIRKWEKLAEKIFKQHQSEASFPPTEQAAAICLSERFNDEKSRLEAKPEFLSAVESLVSELELKFKPIAQSGQQDLIEQRAAQIKSWSALLARLRPTAMDSNGIENKVAPKTQPQEGEQAKSGNTYQLRGQEKAILAKLTEQGHDPLALPPNEPGKPGVKNACKNALSDSPLFKGITTFSKAWERLAVEDIKYSD
ncbi:MAG: hypothetical protein Q8Q28_11145 [Pseudomonadota bacterium]|nr:hypothetical protein [Pseudomonadota bacterium]